MNVSAPGDRERDRSNREKRSADSPGAHRPGVMSDRMSDGSRPRRSRDRARSVSPSRKSMASSENGQRERTSHRIKKRAGRRPTQRKSIGGGAEMAWTRSSKSPAPTPHRTTSRDVMASRQLKQIGAPPLAENDDNFHDSFDDIVANHRDAKQPAFHRSATEPVSPVRQKRTTSDTSSSSKSKKRSSKTAAVASSKDIDQVIAQYRKHCDQHMATLLELKNNITTTEKEVVVSTEKDKEFQQVRQWYSALAEKHTKLQKDYQALQEEHVKLQQKFMSLKQASTLNEDLKAHFEDEPIGGKKKEKKEKGKLDVVWSRAGKIKKQILQ